MEKVSRYLETVRDTVSRNEVERNVTGKGEYVRAAMDALITDGFVDESTGRGKSRPLRSLKPYREGDASDCVPSASGHTQDSSESSASLRPTPYRGDARDGHEVEYWAQVARGAQA